MASLSNGCSPTQPVYGSPGDPVSTCHLRGLTLFIQEMYAETRVKTVGFLETLQPRLDTKLVTPWTVYLPFSRQWRGPPESPCRGEVEGLKTPFLNLWNFAFAHTPLLRVRSCAVLKLQFRSLLPSYPHNPDASLLPNPFFCCTYVVFCLVFWFHNLFLPATPICELFETAFWDCLPDMFPLHNAGIELWTS